MVANAVAEKNLVTKKKQAILLMFELKDVITLQEAAIWFQIFLKLVESEIKL